MLIEVAGGVTPQIFQALVQRLAKAGFSLYPGIGDQAYELTAQASSGVSLNYLFTLSGNVFIDVAGASLPDVVILTQDIIREL